MSVRVRPGRIWSPTNSDEVRLSSLLVKAIVSHTVTYFIAGVLAYNLLNYEEMLGAGDGIMRSATDPWIMAGPLLQPIRGVIFGLAFYPIRKSLFRTRWGWLTIWWLLVALGVLSTFGPAPGSIEGMIYTNQELSVSTYIEVVLQALAFSVLLHLWVTRPGVKWFNWIMGVAFILVMLLPALGLLVGSE